MNLANFLTQMRQLIVLEQKIRKDMQPRARELLHYWADREPTPEARQALIAKGVQAARSEFWRDFTATEENPAP